MRFLLLLGLIFSAAFLPAAYKYKEQKSSPTGTPFKKTAVSCAPDLQRLEALLAESDIPPMPGAGSYQWNISTQSDSARFYFNQGINMYYGFHIIESLASFKKAARFDPQHPMIWWAQALAYGPNINDVGYSASPESLEATQKAVEWRHKANPQEQLLIDAMTKRYSADSTLKRETLNQAYADAMYRAYQQFPDHTDIAVLYADALMLQHPWDFWFNNGKPKPWTPAIRSVLEKLLKKEPLHPGANHYYIHLMEPSPFVALALPSAYRLGKLTPGLAHMVHMPSHIFLRTGQLATGTRINEEAIRQFKKYTDLFPAVNENAFLYLWHNQHMLVNCALLSGREAAAQQAATELQQFIDTAFLSLPAPLGAAVQYIYMTPVLVQVHFSNWQNVAQLPKPAEAHAYASVLYHFAKGMAWAGLQKNTAAHHELKDLQALLVDPVLKVPVGPFSPPLEGALVAEKLLQGTIALKESKENEAIAFLEKAVQLEENMVYNEPKDWLLNPKQYLGKAYLTTNQWKKAEDIFRRDLAVNDQNVWSLQGLLQALQQQNKTGEARKIQDKLNKGFAQGELEKVTLL